MAYLQFLLGDDSEAVHLYQLTDLLSLSCPQCIWLDHGIRLLERLHIDGLWVVTTTGLAPVKTHTVSLGRQSCSYQSFPGKQTLSGSRPLCNVIARNTRRISVERFRCITIQAPCFCKLC